MRNNKISPSHHSPVLRNRDKSSPRQGGYYEARPCQQIEYILGSPSATLSAYPDCAPYLDGSDPAKQVAVEANYSGSAVQLTVALGSNFGAAGWLAFALHAIGVGIYV